MNRLSGTLAGPEMWIKRDDQTGLATGGNKARKLELLIADALGAAAYALAFEELWRQIEEIRAREPLHFDRIVVPSSSGGTQAGLIVGAKACGYQGQVLGISIDKTGGHLRETVLALLAPTAAQLKLDLEFGPDDVQVNDGYLGAGYAMLTDAERDAIRLLARAEGILLDPVYTGKAMAGLLDLVRRGEIGAQETVLFWHTGGSPALFAYAHELLAG